MVKKGAIRSISALIILTLVMTMVAAPTLYGDNVYAKEKTDEGIAAVQLEQNEQQTSIKSSSSTTSTQAAIEKCVNKLPKSVLSGRQVIYDIIGDRQDRLFADDPIPGETIYIPYSTTVYRPNGSSLGTVNFGKDYLNRNGSCGVKMTAVTLGKWSSTTTYYLYQYTGTGSSNYTSDWSYVSSRTTGKQYIEVMGMVYFKANGGKFKSKSIKSKLVTYGKKYGKLASLKKRKGHKFLGWYTATKGGKRIKSNSTVKLSQSTNLYAKWRYKITFNANKGSVSKKSKTVTTGKKYGSLPKPTRSGYKFLGWYTKKKGGTKISKSKYVTINKAHKLYAHWIKKGKKVPQTPYITQTEYNKIKSGMSKAQVDSIVGGPGSLWLTVYVNNYPTYIYRYYTGKSGKNYASIWYIGGVYSKSNNCGW